MMNAPTHYEIQPTDEDNIRPFYYVESRSQEDNILRAKCGGLKPSEFAAPKLFYRDNNDPNPQASDEGDDFFGFKEWEDGDYPFEFTAATGDISVLTQSEFSYTIKMTA